MEYRASNQAKPQIVYLLATAYENGKIIGLIMRNVSKYPQYKSYPYEKVKMSRLTPIDDEIKRIFGGKDEAYAE